MATEIFLGVRPTAEGLEVLPTLPAGWREIAVANLHVRGSTLSIRIRRDSGVRTTTAIVNDEARALAEKGGITFVQDRCIKIEHERLIGSPQT